MDNIEIIYKDDDLLVVNKPAGLLVYLPAGSKPQKTLLDFLRPELSFKNPNERSGIVHRLDRETSGVMVVARNEKTENALKALFRERGLKKEYVALVWGEVTPRKGEISIPLGRGAKDRLKVVPKKLGRESLTVYKVLKFFERSGQSFVSVELKTGRTHQIRVHFAAIGHPIVGDEKYSRRKTRLMRHFLHAERISFPHPSTGKMLSFNAELPKDLDDYLNELS